jgi:DNA-binding IclR family transcriptional regulator
MLAHEPEASLAAIIAQQSFHRFTEHTLVTEAALRDELAAIRARGHAYDREEHEPGIICVAMPILAASGRCLGALSVTGSTARTSMARLEGFLPALRQAAADIARDAESWRFPQSDTAPCGQREERS